MVGAATAASGRGAPRPSNDGRQPRAHAPSIRLRTRSLLAVAASVSLLSAFGLVVHQLTLAGASRRVAVAAHADGVWRCNGLHGRELRDACIVGLGAPPRR